ncbi:metal-dependent hydrolase [Vibrio gallicus]|uniref:metal-dependent hydrolase n=1 Tax=Vibrio gallicus TaxID=190897 RepID=UPI0021C3A863|nr:metal-dependent hydrolase [Vibrio gallicus]
MKITSLGHAAYLIEGNRVKALIDPFLSGNPNTEYDEYSFNDISHIFVTHGHADHLGDTINIAKRCNATVIANAEICGELNKLEVKTHGMHIGGRFQFDFGKVKMTPALHGSRLDLPNGAVYGGNPGGYIIEVDGVKLYHAGDTGLSVEMTLIRKENLDIALLPIGGNYTMDIEDALLAADMLKAKLTIPMHYDTFPLIKANPHTFIQSLPDKLKGCLLAVGESLEV